MKRPQADKSIGDIKEELDNSKTKTSRQMENNFSQARVIPVQHEQASQHWQQPNVQRSTAHQPTFFNHQWPSHNPQQMPQPQYFSTPHPNMANQYYPQQFYQQQQPQQRYPPHPSAHPEPSNNQRRQVCSNSISIPVVHTSPSTKNDSTQSPIDDHRTINNNNDCGYNVESNTDSLRKEATTPTHPLDFGENVSDQSENMRVCVEPTPPLTTDTIAIPLPYNTSEALCEKSGAHVTPSGLVNVDTSGAGDKDEVGVSATSNEMGRQVTENIPAVPRNEGSRFTNIESKGQDLPETDSNLTLEFGDLPSRNTSYQQPHSAGRTIPIQVVHDSTAGKNNFHNQPEQHQSSTLPFHANENRTDPSVGQTSISKSPQINSNPASTSNSDAAPNKLFAATTEHDEVDDHRVVDALKQITAVLADMEEQEKEVDSFSGSRTDKQFLKLENYLTNKLLRLDEINASGAPGAEKVRTERKAAIKRVQHTLDVLELKVLSD